MKKFLVFILTLSSRKNESYNIGCFSNIKSHNIALTIYLNSQTTIGIYAQTGIKIYARDFIFEVGYSTNKNLNLKLELEIFEMSSLYFQVKISPKKSIMCGIGLSFIKEFNEYVSGGLLLEFNNKIEYENNEDNDTEEKIITTKSSFDKNALKKPSYFIKNPINIIEKMNVYNFNELTKELDKDTKKNKKKTFYILFHIFFDDIQNLIKKKFEKKEKIEDIYKEIFKIFHAFTNEFLEYLQNTTKNDDEKAKDLHNLIESININSQSKTKVKFLISNFKTLFENLNILKNEDHNFTIDKILDSMNSKIGSYHFNYYNNFYDNDFFFSLPNIESSDDFNVDVDLKKLHPILSKDEYNRKICIFETSNDTNNQKDKDYKFKKYKKVDETFNLNLMIKEALFKFFPDLNLIYIFQNICHAMLVIETKNQFTILDTNKIKINQFFNKNNNNTVNLLTGSNCVVHSLFLAILTKYYKNEKQAIKVSLALDHLLEKDYSFVKNIVESLFDNQIIKKDDQKKIDNEIHNQPKIEIKIQNTKYFSNFLREMLVKQNLAKFKKDDLDRLKKRLENIIKKDEKYLTYALIRMLSQNPMKENEIIKAFDLINKFKEKKCDINKNDLSDNTFINMLLILESLYTNDYEKVKKSTFDMHNSLKNNITKFNNGKIKALLLSFNI